MHRRRGPPRRPSRIIRGLQFWAAGVGIQSIDRSARVLTPPAAASAAARHSLCLVLFTFGCLVVWMLLVRRRRRVRACVLVRVKSSRGLYGPHSHGPPFPPAVVVDRSTLLPRPGTFAPRSGLDGRVSSTQSRAPIALLWAGARPSIVEATGSSITTTTSRAKPTTPTTTSVRATS